MKGIFYRIMEEQGGEMQVVAKNSYAVDKNGTIIYCDSNFDCKEIRE